LHPFCPAQATIAPRCANANRHALTSANDSFVGADN
jgi:hypothetical protein